MQDFLTAWRQGASEERSLTVGRGALLGTPMETTHKSIFGPGTTSSMPQMVDQATQKKNNSTGNSRVMTRAQKARTESAQTSGPEGKAGDRIYHLKAQGGRVSHAAGTRLGGHEKLI